MERTITGRCAAVANKCVADVTVRFTAFTSVIPVTISLPEQNNIDVASSIRKHTKRGAVFRRAYGSLCRKSRIDTTPRSVSTATETLLQVSHCNGCKEDEDAELGVINVVVVVRILPSSSLLLHPPSQVVEIVSVGSRRLAAG